MIFRKNQPLISYEYRHFRYFFTDMRNFVAYLLRKLRLLICNINSIQYPTSGIWKIGEK